MADDFVCGNCGNNEAFYPTYPMRCAKCGEGKYLPGFEEKQAALKRFFENQELHRQRSASQLERFSPLPVVFGRELPAGISELAARDIVQMIRG